MMNVIAKSSDLFQRFKTAYKKSNRNVKLAFLFQFLSQSASSIWLETATPFWIEIETNSAIMVGWGSGAEGICLLIFSVVAAYIIDKGFRRDSILKWTILVAVVSTLITALGVWFESIPTFFAGLVVFGIVFAFSYPAVESSFADSVPTNERSFVYSLKNVAGQLGAALGPLLALILFALSSNSYNSKDLSLIIYTGLLLNLIAGGIMYFFDDDRALTDASEAFDTDMKKDNSSNSPIDIEKCTTAAELIAAKYDAEVLAELERPKFLQCFNFVKMKHFPFVLASSNFIMSFGAGLSIRYFSLLLKEIYGVSPVGVNGIYCAMTIFVGVFVMIAQRVSQRLGRVKAMLLFQMIGASLLVLISFYPPLWLLVILMFLRTGCMRAPAPLAQSIVMDFVPKKDRGKWNAVELFAWGLMGNGSSILGGYIVQWHGYNWCFTITAIIYFLASLPSIVMIGMVPVERQRKVAVISVAEASQDIQDTRDTASLLNNDELAADDSELDTFL